MEEKYLRIVEQWPVPLCQHFAAVFECEDPASFENAVQVSMESLARFVCSVALAEALATNPPRVPLDSVLGPTKLLGGGLNWSIQLCLDSARSICKRLGPPEDLLMPNLRGKLQDAQEEVIRLTSHRNRKAHAVAQSGSDVSSARSILGCFQNLIETLSFLGDFELVVQGRDAGGGCHAITHSWDLDSERIRSVVDAGNATVALRDRTSHATLSLDPLFALRGVPFVVASTAREHGLSTPQEDRRLLGLFVPARIQAREREIDLKYDSTWFPRFRLEQSFARSELVWDEPGESSWATPRRNELIPKRDEFWSRLCAENLCSSCAAPLESDQRVCRGCGTLQVTPPSSLKFESADRATGLEVYRHRKADRAVVWIPDGRVQASCATHDDNDWRFVPGFFVDRFAFRGQQLLQAGRSVGLVSKSGSAQESGVDALVRQMLDDLVSGQAGGVAIPTELQWLRMRAVLENVHPGDNSPLVQAKQEGWELVRTDYSVERKIRHCADWSLEGHLLVLRGTTGEDLPCKHRKYFSRFLIDRNLVRFTYGNQENHGV